MVESLPAVGAGLVPQASQHSGITGKLLVPVAPQNAIYARFRYVVGVTAGEGGGGVPLVKLRILDNLIDSYIKTRRDPALSQPEGQLEVRVTPGTIDNMIAAVGADLHETLSARPEPFGGFYGRTGLVLSLGA